MADILKQIIQKIVDHPDAVSVTEEISPENTFILTISAHQEDLGKIIGREGKVIKALRDLMKILAVKDQKRITVQIAEPLPPAPSRDPSSAN